MNTLPRLHLKSLPWGVILSLSMILLISVVGLIAPLIAPYDPTQMQVGLSNYPPAWYNTPPKVGQPDHLLGTDFFGRDILSHILHGARAAMFLVLIAIPLTAVIGVAIGILAGMGNRTVETIFLRFTDIISSVPTFMFAVILVFILRATPTGTVFGGLLTLTFAFALVNWVGLAKLLYASVLTIKQQLFMEAARSLGAGTFRQIFKHVLPHIGYLLIVWMINNIPAIILLEALLGYIGSPARGPDRHCGLADRRLPSNGMIYFRESD